jgi:hypothetical protein
MDKKTNRSAGTVALIASAATLGYGTRAAFRTAVESASKLVPSNYLTLIREGASDADKAKAKPFTATIQDFGDEYKAGHLVAYLEPHYRAKRWSNLGMPQMVESAKEILAKPEPDSDKSNRRTALEHKGCRAAISAWSHLKGEAGLKRQAKPRVVTATPTRRAAGDEKQVPSSNLTVPKFSAPIDAVKFFDRISADLLNKAVNGNALATPIAIKTAVQDFRKAIRAAVASAKAGQVRSTKAKAAKDTLPISVIAARGNGASKGNGASVN